MAAWLAIDGFEAGLPGIAATAGEFGYAGSGDNRSAFPKARVVALAECGTHAFLAAEAGPWSAGEKTVASQLYPRLRPGELLTADRNFYSWDAWELAAGTGAALLWRAPAQLELPVAAVLPDGSYLSVLVGPGIRRARRAAIIEAARAGQDIDPGDAHLVRGVEYDVPDREGSGSGELDRAANGRAIEAEGCQSLSSPRRACPGPRSPCQRVHEAVGKISMTSTP